MKWIKIFGLFVAIHILGWGGSHFYLSNNPEEVLVVADTSYSMKPSFSEMESWIEDYDSRSRYKKLVVGTDKALLGELDQLKSMSTIFRTGFGRMNPDALKRYDGFKNAEKILLSDGAVQVDGWTVVEF